MEGEVLGIRQLFILYPYLDPNTMTLDKLLLHRMQNAASHHQAASPLRAKTSFQLSIPLGGTVPW